MFNHPSVRASQQTTGGTNILPAAAMSGGKG